MKFASPRLQSYSRNKRLRTGVKIAVYFLQAGAIDVRVNLGGCDTGMAEHFLVLDADRRRRLVRATQSYVARCVDLYRVKRSCAMRIASPIPKSPHGAVSCRVGKA